MSWYDALKPASFRGVKFEVVTSDRSEGLNTVLRDYPFQDLPTIFSMGQASGEIKFSAHVIGNDYIDKLNALEKALLVQESGVLVHPTLGSIRVFHHGKFSIKESYVDEGGMARLDLTFIRAEPRKYPSDAVNTQVSSFQSTLDSITSSVQDFVGRYNLNGVAGWVRTNVFERIQSLHSAVYDLAFSIKQGTDGLGDLIKMGYGAETYLKDMLMMPQSLGDHFAQMLSLDKNLTPEQAANAAAELIPQVESPAPLVLLPDGLPMRTPSLVDLVTYQILPEYSPYLTQSRKTDAAHCEALQRLIQRLAYCTLVQAACQMKYQNYDAALKIRDVIDKHGKRLLMEASQEASPFSITSHISVHDALLKTYTEALKHIQSESFDLAKLIKYSPKKGDSIWTISYELYGSVDFADEIWSMNTHITNPLLVPEGIDLRVIDRR